MPVQSGEPVKHDIAIEKKQIDEKEFWDLIKMGFVHPSNLKWSSSIHLMPKKKHRSGRTLDDFRRLNFITILYRYNFSEKFNGGTLFCKINLVSAFHPILVSSSDAYKTKTITPVRLFELEWLPFGLKNAASQQLAKCLSTKLIQTTAYHSQSIRIVERFH